LIIWSVDKKLFTVATLKNHRMNEVVATKRLRTRSTLVGHWWHQPVSEKQSAVVPHSDISRSRIHGYRIFEAYYRNVMPLNSYCQISGEFIYQQDSYSARLHRAHKAINFLPTILPNVDILKIR